jgi:hypothetical protein
MEDRQLLRSGPAAPTGDALSVESATSPPILYGELSVRSWVARNAHVCIAAAIYALALLIAGAHEFVQDTWLTLVGGRDIARHGLPWHDRLTVLTHGKAWVDQQWLGKLFLYGTAMLGGGLSLLFIVHVAFVLAGFVGAMVLARRRGASDRAVFWITAATIPTAPWAWQLRAQSLSYVLFVAVLGLLAADSVRPSRRVWIVLPLIVLWANIHGSVTLGVALTAVAGLAQLPRRPIRGVVLIVGASACLFASPYGFHLVHYYRSLLFNPLLGHFVGEWQPSASPAALPFFAFVIGVAWLVGRNRQALTSFERLALAVTAAAGFTALRGIVWFLLTALVLVPKLLDGDRREKREASRLVMSVAALCGFAAVVVGAHAVARLPHNVDASFPNDVARAVAHEASTRPGVKVFASEAYADWLLWKDPALAGRLVYDIRFELFDRKSFDELLDFHGQAGPHWQRILHGARLLVLYKPTDRRAADALRAEAGARVLYENRDLVVILRPRAAA